MYKVWGIGDICKEELSKQDFSHIEAVKGDDLNNHMTLQRMARNMHENQEHLYKFLTNSFISLNKDKGIIKGSEEGFSIDGISLKIGRIKNKTSFTVNKGGSLLGGKSFVLKDTKGTLFTAWFNTGTNVISIPSGNEGIEIQIETGYTPTEVAERIAITFSNLYDFHASISGDLVEIQHTVPGEITGTPVEDTDTGFSFTTVVAGGDLTKSYVRVKPGICFFEKHIMVNTPQTFIAERQLESFLKLVTWVEEGEREKVSITYNEEDDTFSATIKKRNLFGAMDTYTYEDKASGIELLSHIYLESAFHDFLEKSIGENLEKIFLEPVFPTATGVRNVGVKLEEDRIALYEGETVPADSFNFLNFTVDTSSSPIITSIITDSREYYQNPNDFGNSLFLNVPAEYLMDTSLIIDPETDDSVDYSTIENKDQYLTFFNEAGGANSNAILKWDKINQRFCFNKDIYFSGSGLNKTIQEISASSESTVENVSDISDLYSLVDVPNGAVRFVINENRFYRYFLSSDMWVGTSDPFKQYSGNSFVTVSTENQDEFTSLLKFKRDGKNLQVFKDGLKQNIGAGEDYTILSTNTIKFNVPLSSGVKVSLYIIDGGEMYYPDEYWLSIPSSPIQTITEIPFTLRVGKQSVYRNGLYLRESIFRRAAVQSASPGNKNSIVLSSDENIDSGDYVVSTNSGNMGEIRIVDSITGSGPFTITLTEDFTNNTLENNEYMIFSPKDFLVNEPLNEILFIEENTGNEEVLIKDSFAVSGNWEMLNKGSAFPETPVFGLTFFHTDSESWYRWNGSIWAQA